MTGEQKLVFFSLDSYVINTSLKNYYHLLRSHYNDNNKFIINSCNNKLLAYHHLTTINHVEFNHPLFQLINSMIKEMPYCGLYFGVIISSYLSKILKLLQEMRLTTKETAHIEIIAQLNRLRDIVFKSLNKQKQKETIKGHRLVSIVESSLRNLSIEQIFKKNLAVSIVKTVLLAADENSSKLGHIQIKTVDNKNYCEAYNGVLYKLETLWEPKIKTLNYECSILLFTEALDFISFSDNLKITEIEFIESLIAAGIKIIACQKTIDKKLIFSLQRQNIIALERLGEETANVLGNLSGAFPVSDCNRVNLKKLYNYVGIINRLRYISILDENYLLLENNSSSIVTLFVSCRSFDTLDQLKAVIKECIHAIFSIFQHPWFLPHNFDAYLVDKLNNFKNSNVILKRIMILFAETLKESSSPSLENADVIQHKDIYLIKRNSLAQVFSTISNILQVGMYIVKN